MRLTRILLWSTGILLAAILVGCLMLALFFPRDSFEDRLKGSLNDRIRPLRVDFSRVRLFWNDGPGLSVDELRLFASGTQAGHNTFLSAGRLTFRPSLEDLTDRQVAAHFIVESPVFRSDQAEGEVPALAGIVGALAQGLGAPQVGQGGAASSPRPESLSALVPLPAGFTLMGVSLEMRDGSLDAAPSSVMSGMRASLRVDPDLSFKAELRKGTLRWGRRDEKGPLRLSSIVGAEIRGRAVSLEGLQKGLHQYYGTLQIDHVEMDELLRLVSPRLEGKARGIADANLAFRGTGLAWPEAAATLEAKARVYVNHLALDGGDDPKTDSKEDLTERLGHVVEGIDTEETVPQEEDLIDPEQERLLTANRAAGWFTMREGSIHTDNLVAIYEGRLIEVQGSVDLAGRLQVEKGKIFNGGRMVPFRLDCMLGEERCSPSPDLEERGKSAAAELSAALRLLSEATQGVYRDLSFQIGDSHRIKPNSPKVLPP